MHYTHLCVVCIITLTILCTSLPLPVSMMWASTVYVRTLSLEPLQRLESELATSQQQHSEHLAQAEQKEAKEKVGSVTQCVHFTTEFIVHPCVSVCLCVCAVCSRSSGHS